MSFAIKEREVKNKVRGERREAGVGAEAKGGASHPIGWQVSDGLASTCSLEGTETPP